MEYVVIHSFTDKDTKEHYTVGERYPHRGFAKKARIDVLSSADNQRGMILIQPKGEDDVPEEEPVKKERKKKKND